MPRTISQQGSFVAQSGLGHLDLATGVVNAVLAPLLLGIDLQLHFLEGIHHFLLANAQVFDGHIELGGPIFRRNHFLREGGHHVAAGKQAEVGNLLVVGAAQPA